MVNMIQEHMSRSQTDLEKLNQDIVALRDAIKGIDLELQVHANMLSIPELSQTAADVGAEHLLQLI